MVIQIDVETHIGRKKYKRYAFALIGISVDDVLDVFEDLGFDIDWVDGNDFEANLVRDNVWIFVDGSGVTDYDDVVAVMNANKWIVKAILNGIIDEVTSRWYISESMES